MFLLAEMKDTVRIPPWKFNLKLNKAISDELNRKLANKVILLTYFVSCHASHKSEFEALHRLLL